MREPKNTGKKTCRPRLCARCVRDAPLDILEGELGFLSVANFFSPWKENNFFFGRGEEMTVPQTCFLCLVEELIMSYAFPIMYVTIVGCFFRSITTTNFFCSANIFKKLFFRLLWLQTCFHIFCYHTNKKTLLWWT